MDIKNHNWSPAIEMFEEMEHFNANIEVIQQGINAVPDFIDNFGKGTAPAHLSLEELQERKLLLIQLQANVDSTLRVLDSVVEAYHRYQEMYFENL